MVWYKFLCLVVLFVLIVVSFTGVFLAGGIVVSGRAGLLRVVFYYGWLDCSGVLGRCFDVLVFSGVYGGGAEDHMLPVLEKLGSRVMVFAYLHNDSRPFGLGSSFRELVIEKGLSVDRWVGMVLILVNRTVEAYSVGGRRLITGVFLDEADPGYLGRCDKRFVGEFVDAVIRVISAVHRLGLKVFINGVRGFAPYADYYLWEDFLSNSSYVFDKSFLYRGDNGDPFEWENGIGKYFWLQSHGLLSRTIVLCYADARHMGYAVAAYYVSLMLGLGGYGFAPADLYAGGERLYSLYVYDYGPLVYGPIIDYRDNVLSAVFMFKRISICFNNASINTPVYRFAVDGLPLEYRRFFSIEAGDIRVWRASYNATLAGIYMYMNTTYPSPTDILLHIYIDVDGSAETGYGMLGADRLVEIYSDGSAIIYSYNGNGQDWNWEKIGSIPAVTRWYGHNSTLELMIPSKYYTTKSILYIDPDYNNTDYNGFKINMSREKITPIISLLSPPEEYKSLSKYIPVAENITEQHLYTEIILQTPGNTSTIKIYTAYPPIMITINNIPITNYTIEEYNGYYKTIIYSLKDGQRIIKIYGSHMVRSTV